MGGAAVHLGVAELDVASDRVGHHRGNGVVHGLSEKSGVGVPRAGRGVPDDSRAGDAILHGTAVSGIRAENFPDAALGGIWHSVLSVTDLVELDVLELGIGGHCDLIK